MTPLGIGLEDNWRRLQAGESGIGPITRFDASGYATTIAGEVRDWDPTPWMPKKEVRRSDLFIQYAIAAGDMAMEMAGLREGTPDPERAGCYVGSGMGGLTTIEQTLEKIIEKGPRLGISPYFTPGVIINLAPGQLSIRYNLKGPNMSMVSACSTGAHSIGEAARLIERGDMDIMLAGGSESTVTQLGVGGFCASRALSSRNDEPTKASRPFTASRDGFVLSEGSAIMVLESYEHAQARGATIIAEVLGYAANSDAHHITAPAPNGEGGARCMKLALKDAGISPEQVGYINAHATSTDADILETAAIRTVFGAHADPGKEGGLAVSSTKSMHGHLLGATGSLEAAITALALRDGILPPTINLDDPDPQCDLDYVPHTARKADIEYAMSNSFGFGGTNASVVLRKA